MLPRALALLAAVLLATPTLAADQNRPNFLIVLSDDLGYGDLACYGHPTLITPNIDQFAAEGLKLTSCYAGHPNCSPSRTAIMTGRFPFRVGVWDWIPVNSPMHVPKSEITVATLLRRAGYDTAHVGKWHMNGKFNSTAQPQPPDHGFNYWFSTQNNALPNHHNPANFVRNAVPVGKLRGYAAPLVAREAIHWLQDVRDKTKPFFLYVCFHEPHEPINTDPKYANLYTTDDPSLAAHHGNITQMDAAFGKLMTAVDKLGLRKNTYIMFTSDNGPAITRIHPHGSAGPLRAKKGHLYEGGIRVPGIIRWPGHTKPGSQSDIPVSGIDLLPTVCEIAGIPLPSDRAIDGTSFLPVIKGKPIKRETPLYWHFPRAKSIPKVAMRIGDWKILATLEDLPEKQDMAIRPGEMKALKTATLATFELYNLAKDIGESNNLAKNKPKKLKEMIAKLRPLYKEVVADAPNWPLWKRSGHGREIDIIWPAYSKRGQRQRADAMAERKKSEDTQHKRPRFRHTN